MLQNQLKSAFRNLIRHRSNSLINLSGFTICLVCLAFIFLHVREESGYDTFHKDVDRIYRVTSHQNLSGFDVHSAYTGYMVAEGLRSVSSIDHVTRLWNDYDNPFAVVHEDKKFIEHRVYMSDTNFFKVFDVEMVMGSAQNALKNKNGLVISEEMAQKYFGDENPMGKIFSITASEISGDFIVTGVAKRFPKKSHIHFDFLGSMEMIDMWWKSRYTTTVVGTYFKAKLGSRPEDHLYGLQSMVERDMDADFDHWTNRSYAELKEQGLWFEFRIQRLTDIYLKSGLRSEFEPVGDIREIRMISLVGLVILVLAIINYVNLSTANATLRAKEIGIRKVLGTRTRQLVSGFMLESLLVSFTAFILALGLCTVLLSSFNTYAEHSIGFTQLLAPEIILGLFGLSLTFGAIAGLYPSVVLSRMKMQMALKGETSFRKGNITRNALVVIQFGLSTFLIIATLVIGDQLDFIQKKKLGFNTERVVAVQRSMADELDVKRFGEFADRVKGVKSAAVTSHIPRQAMISTPFNRIKDNPDTRVQMQILKVDDDYEEVLGLELVAGRWFDHKMRNDSMSIILSEMAVESLGLEGEPIGQKVHGWLKTPHTVIGVIKDFHAISLHHEILPSTLLSADLPWAVPLISWVMVGIEPGIALPEVLDDLEKVWNATIPDRPFEYVFMDDHIRSLYESEQRTASIFKLFAGLAIFIAVLGLFGLVTFMIHRRLKEIGVRKVLGASILQLYKLLTTSLGKPVLISLVISLPPAIWMMTKWLSDFSYRIELGPESALYAIALVILLSLATVSHALIKASKTNPADILRNE